MELTAVLIDDEQECLDYLQHVLASNCPEVEVKAVCSSGKDGVKAIGQSNPDLVFLDIDMPYINGFDVIEMVPDPGFEVIFTTAYDKYAIRAFKISAVDYLLKPIDSEELVKAVEKVKRLKERAAERNPINFLLQQIKDVENNSVKRIALPTFDGLEFVKLDNILYCQSDGSYSNVFFTDGQKRYISKSLHFLEDALCDYHFYRVHKSYIVNLNKVQRYSKTDGGILVMENGDLVKVSRSKKDELLNIL